MSPINRGISYSESLLYSVHRLIDAAIICLTVGLGTAPHRGGRRRRLAGRSPPCRLSFTTWVADLSGLYRSWRGTRLRNELVCVFVTWAYTVPVLLGLGLVTQYNAEFSYQTKMVWIFGTPVSWCAARIVMRKFQQRLRAQGFNSRTYAVCGVNELGIQLARNIETAPELGLRLAGFYDDRPAERTAELPAEFGHRVGNLDELVRPGPAGHDRQRLHHLSRCGPKSGFARCSSGWPTAPFRSTSCPTFSCSSCCTPAGRMPAVCRR